MLVVPTTDGGWPVVYLNIQPPPGLRWVDFFRSHCTLTAKLSKNCERVAYQTTVPKKSRNSHILLNTITNFTYSTNTTHVASASGEMPCLQTDPGFS